MKPWNKFLTKYYFKFLINIELFRILDVHLETFVAIAKRQSLENRNVFWNFLDVSRKEVQSECSDLSRRIHRFREMEQNLER